MSKNPTWHFQNNVLVAEGRFRYFLQICHATFVPRLIREETEPNIQNHPLVIQIIMRCSNILIDLTVFATDVKSMSTKPIVAQSCLAERKYRCRAEQACIACHRQNIVPIGKSSSNELRCNERHPRILLLRLTKIRHAESRHIPVV